MDSSGSCGTLSTSNISSFLSSNASTTSTTSSTFSSTSVLTIDDLSNRISQMRTGSGDDAHIDETWLENFLERQEARRLRYQNSPNSHHLLNKQLRQCTKSLNQDTTDTVEKHYRRRRHVQRKDSKVSGPLKQLIHKRQICYSDAENKMFLNSKKNDNNNSLDFKTENNKDSSNDIIQINNGWIDVCSDTTTTTKKTAQDDANEQEEFSFSSSFSNIFVGNSKQQPKKRLDKLQEGDDDDEEIEVTTSDKDFILLHDKKTDYNYNNKLHSKPSKKEGKNKKCNVKKFVKKKTRMDDNKRLDNGAFSLWSI